MNINEKKSFDVIVIGGGAAGMMAAITAASNGADTMILEHKDRVGKKILSTGNGKCNYTNELQGVTYYRGDDPACVLPVMEQFGFEETVSFFSYNSYNFYIKERIRICQKSRGMEQSRKYCLPEKQWSILRIRIRWQFPVQAVESLIPMH